MLRPRRCRTASSCYGPARVAALVVLLATAASAQLTFESGPVDESTGRIPQVVVLQEDGIAADEVVFSFVVPDGEAFQSAQVTDLDDQTITAVDITEPELEPGVRNITAMFSFDGLVGESDYTMTVTTDARDYSLTGSYRVAGLTLTDGGAIVSGIGNNLEVGTFDDIINNNNGLFEFDVVSESPEGGPIDPADLQIEVRARGNEISYDPATCPVVAPGGTLAEGCGVGFSEDGSKVFVQFNPFRAGEDPIKVNFRSPNIVDEETGAEFQQELNIVIDDSLPVPPLVVAPSELAVDFYGGELFILDGSGWARTDNPLSSAFLEVGSAQWPLAVADSSFGEDTMLFFDTAPGAGESGSTVRVTGGNATFETGEAPILLSNADGSDINVTFPVEVSNSALAATGEFTAEQVAGLAWIGQGVRIAPYTATTFSEFKNEQIRNALASRAGIDVSSIVLSAVGEPGAARVVSSQRVVYPWETSVRQDSEGVVATYQFLYPEDTFEELNDTTVAYIESGLARDVNLRDQAVTVFGESETLGLPETPTPSVSATPSEEPGDGGLPVWARIVIGVVAGLLGLALIGCLLFFFIGRDRDEDASTEPEFTVEGPASVPVPVEYPVVRDAFGRGHYEQELGSGEVDPDAGLPVEVPRVNSSL